MATSLDHRPAFERQRVAGPLDRDHIDAVAQIRGRGGADFGDGALDEVGGGDRDIARHHDHVHAFRGLQFRAELLRQADHAGAAPDQEDDVAGLELERRLRPDQRATALDALDADRLGAGALDFGDAAAGRGFDAIDAPDQIGRRRIFADAVAARSGEQLRLGLDRVVADAATHEPGQNVDADDDRAEGAEDVGDGVADRDIGLQALGLVCGEAEFADRGAGRADDRRLGQAARRDPGGEPLVEAEHARQHDDGDEAADRQHGRHRDLAQRLAAERAEELRAALIADGVDEQCEENGFDAVVDRDAHLADDHRGQERAGDAAELELAELEFADPVADGQRQEEGDLRRLGE